MSLRVPSTDEQNTHGADGLGGEEGIWTATCSLQKNKKCGGGGITVQSIKLLIVRLFNHTASTAEVN
jgi:hypothetical protein